MAAEEGHWFGYRRNDGDPGAEQPVAEVTVRVYRLERGGSELRFKTKVPEGTTRRDWYEAIARSVIEAVQEAPDVFASDHG